MENYGSVIRGFDGTNHFEGATFGGAVGGIDHVVEGGFDVAGGKGPAIMKADTAAQMENVGEGVGGIPGFSEVAVEIHLGIAFYETVEDQPIDTLGFGIGGVARVEIRRIGFDDEDDFGWIAGRIPGTSNEEQREQGNCR